MQPLIRWGFTAVERTALHTAPAVQSPLLVTSWSCTAAFVPSTAKIYTSDEETPLQSINLVMRHAYYKLQCVDRDLVADTVPRFR